MRLWSFSVRSAGIDAAEVPSKTPTIRMTDALAQRWLQQVADDHHVSSAACLVAHEIAIAAHDGGEVRLSVRDLVKAHREDGIDAATVRAGIESLRDRGHIEADRDGRCWKIALVRKMAL
jgi:DNA-binding transcriptional regulator PaaX